MNYQPIVLLLIITTLILNGCIQQQEIQPSKQEVIKTEYVCPIGIILSNPEDCVKYADEEGYPCGAPVPETMQEIIENRAYLCEWKCNKIGENQKRSQCVPVTTPKLKAGSICQENEVYDTITRKCFRKN